MGPALRCDHGIAVPVRAFRLGNTRLAGGLDDETRAALARRLATRVVAAADGAPVVVVTADEEVTDWAADLGAEVVADPGSLDGAARAGIEALALRGCARAVVAHSDLPLVTTFAPVLHDAGRATAVLVPCHHDDGTPVLSIPTAAASAFVFAYGPGSFRRHVVAARAAGLAVRVVRDAALGFDVDTLDDVAALERRDPTLLGVRTTTEVPS
jgi:2-phospho-L-lactate guanylyltransferase